ncbi:hypothetical protein [Vibrio alfacsensis]|uniref:hypothetical protein n=1 Tax=Vibrio alfacsensis TaxID=1074311 RepID=UPI004067823F
MTRNIKILLAEDQVDKYQDIHDVISSRFPNVDILHTVSYSGTTKKIKSENFDIVILDMSMPNFDPKQGQKPSLKALAGKDIMTMMKYRGFNYPTIIVTQFDIFGRHSDAISIDTLTNDLMTDFPDIFSGCVFYNMQSNLWENELISTMESIINE